MKGPPLQRDLALILLNWRRYRFVFTTDIVKMFRQIGVAPADQDCQRVVWSPDPAVEPVDYRLTTVTYGTNSAPYLAIRTLLQLAQDEGGRFPLGARCLEHYTYVDDVFAGADDLSFAMRKRSEVVELLGLAGFSLDKWAANHPSLLPVPPQSVSSTRINDDESVKTLGIYWDSIQDAFKFDSLVSRSTSDKLTKRAILSDISRLFDPLGWLAPVTVVAKILMQDLWIMKCEWDTVLPVEIRSRWQEYCDSLADLPKISISRWLGHSAEVSCQIHGFADGSSRAYAAVVYLRLDSGNEPPRVCLLAAKTKVAPVKTISIPKLELCGASLLVKLISHLRTAKFLTDVPVYAWSDSQIVLAWLRKHPSSWKTFTANRVSYIQTELPSASWAHVSTKENPADLATRGSLPSALAFNALWWSGPSWLTRSSDRWPLPSEIANVLHVHAQVLEPEILGRFSSFTRLVRVIAFCRRLLVMARCRMRGANPLPPFLSTEELSEARIVVFRLAQSAAFAAELKRMFERLSGFYKEVASLLANEGTEWTFRRMHRIMEDWEHTLTYEEFSTWLAQVEACLNSRPLSQLSEDVDDLRALTPMHFLIGEAPALLPDDGPLEGPENRLDRFQLLQRLLHSFWGRWSSKYLQHLQERSKWRTPEENMKVGQLVLVKDGRYPPAKWPLGRIKEVHPGPDNLVRVVTVETATSTFRRHVAGLSPLTIGEEPGVDRRELAADLNVCSSTDEGGRNVRGE
ncbi:PREDICTED: uncharacterized protein LOC105556757 [Vollenhovia emeryi]|uniref:uncharacterized protein LOC105556757 n=1 Tax=Vollenhovia emeryi TaxID=411798 RepID=UPI0005F3DCFE|nr:PREDICTED: uncharacterized protein LOC105556757 [Vollenhovia emeryi]